MSGVDAQVDESLRLRVWECFGLVHSDVAARSQVEMFVAGSGSGIRRVQGGLGGVIGSGRPAAQ